jgi:hypothetical protein
MMTNTRKTRYVIHVARTGKKKSMYTVLAQKLEVKIPYGAPKHRWDDNNKNGS